MVKFNFKHYVENLRDIFGFEKEVNQAQNISKVDDLPIKTLSVHVVMDRLATNNISIGRPKSKYLSEMQWGDQPGAVRVQWTPKLNVKIQKLHHDLEGNDVWIMKKFFFVNDRDFAGKEDVVADEIFEQVKMVAEGKLESVMESGEFKFDNIVWSLASKMRQSNYDFIDFEGVKKLNENEYDLYFWINGGGQGQMFGPRGQRPALALIVKMAYSENTGLIKAIAEMVQGVDDTTNWTIQPAEFEEHYMPTQPKNEIIDSVISALRWF